jgi:hypothetical protein
MLERGEFDVSSCIFRFSWSQTAMTVRKLVAAAAAAIAAGTLAASAADLDYSLKDSPYDDPRYSDIYKHPTPAPRYAKPYYPPAPPHAAPPYVEERYAPPPPPVYGYNQQPNYYNSRTATGCVPRETIRAHLESRGWHDFHDPQPMGNVVHIRARRPSGQLFDITLDRCSGRILALDPMNQHAAVPPPPPYDWRYQQRPYRY